MKLTIDKASLIVDQAFSHARANKIRPLCVAVLDDGGNLKASSATTAPASCAANHRPGQSLGRYRYVVRSSRHLGIA